MRSHGAGSEMRRTLGVAVFSGMLGVTLFGIVLTPVFFYTIDWLGDSRLFRSRAARWIGRFTLDVLRLGIVWRAIRGAFTRVTASSRSKLSSREAQPSAKTGDIGHVNKNGAAVDASANGHGPSADVPARKGNLRT
jgi:multidrug efflux pump